MYDKIESLFKFSLIKTEEQRQEMAMPEKVSNHNSLQWSFNCITGVQLYTFHLLPEKRRKHILIIKK